MRVSPGRLIITAACCAAAAAVPASIAQATSTGAALSTAVGAGAGAGSGSAAQAGSVSPGAVRLAAEPAHPTVGQQVRLTVTAAPAGAPTAGAPPGGAAGFVWDLAGRGAYSRHTGHVAQTEVAFQTPGIHTVAVRFIAGGRVRLGVLSVTVAPRRAARVSHAARVPHASGTRADSGGLSGRVTAHAAGDPGVTIADFHFSPAATTIHVGDTITWSNNGPSSHTASATGGSFNTGILKKGQSASHTFTQPGTFAYVCQIHPFMHGTIVVLAATTSTTASGTTTPTTTAPAATAAAASTGPTLPNTGFNVLAGLSAGLVLLGLGASLRRTRAR